MYHSINEKSQYWRLYIKPSLHINGRDEPSQKCLPHRNSYANVGASAFIIFRVAHTHDSFVFIIVFFLNLFLLIADSSGAVPFGECPPNLCLRLWLLIPHYRRNDGPHRRFMVWYFCAVICCWGILRSQAWGMILP